jgi:hypothetical protein
LKQKLASALLVLMVFSGITQTAMAQDPPTPVAPTVDPNVAAQYSLGVCTTTEQLDCIESVHLKSTSGEFVAATSDQEQTWTTRTDNQGNLVYQSQKIYLTPTTDGSISYFGVTAHLDSPAMLHADGRTASALRVNISGLPVGNHAKVSIRTSWMKLQDVQLKANFATFSQSAIPGGNLLTFSGSHAKVSNYRSITGLADWSKQADIDDMYLHFIVHHAGPTPETSYFNPKCAHAGYTIQSFNAPSAGVPQWDPGTQSLSFNIAAPHLDSSGNPNTGFYKLWVPESFAMCQWPQNNLVAASELVATVFNEDGSIQDADISVTKNNGVIFLDARSFHYSIPTIQISAAGTAVKPAKIGTGKKASASPSPSASKASKAPEVTMEQTEASQAGEAEDVALYIAAGIVAVGGIGLGALAFIRNKQGKPLFPLKKNSTDSKEAKPKKKGTKTKP